MPQKQFYPSNRRGFLMTRIKFRIVQNHCMCHHRRIHLYSKCRKMKRYIVMLFVFVAFGSCDSDDGDINPNDNIPLSEKTYIPDDDFEQFLIDLGYDDVLDNYVITSKIKDIERIQATEGYGYSWSGVGINDFTGIEDFSNLQYLDCSKNILRSLDLSKNTKLKVLKCHDCNLLNLDVSYNEELERLICDKNKLSSLDLTQNPKLKYLEVGSIIIYDSRWGNNIESLDLTNNKELEQLSCNNNNISSIDLSQNTKLKTFNCYGNNIAELDLSNNLNLVSIDCRNNPVSCIQINEQHNDLIGSNGEIPIWQKDQNDYYSLDCGY